MMKLNSNKVKKIDTTNNKTRFKSFRSLKLVHIILFVGVSQNNMFMVGEQPKCYKNEVELPVFILNYI